MIQTLDKVRLTWTAAAPGLAALGELPMNRRGIYPGHGHTQIHALDAKRVQDGPLCRIRLPGHASHGAHADRLPLGGTTGGAA